MALQAAHQEQRLIGAVWVNQAVDAGGIFLAARRGE
jgi:hypothetical protein